jgi:hypothetical protein
MKKQINEFKRMQQLAGIIVENQANNNQYVSKVDWYYVEDYSDYPGPTGRVVPDVPGYDDPKDYEGTMLYIPKGTKGYVDSYNNFEDEEGNTVPFEPEYFDTESQLNEAKNYVSFPGWLNAFMEEYKDEHSIIDPIEENGLDKAQTAEEFYNIVKEKGRIAGKNYASEKSFIVYRIGKNITASAPISYKGEQLYWVNFSNALSTYGTWRNNGDNDIVPSSTNQSSKVYHDGSKRD